MLTSRYQVGSACTHRQAPLNTNNHNSIIIATGTTDGGGGFEDSQAELVVIKLDVGDNNTGWNKIFNAKLDAQQRVGCLNWSKDGNKLFGGMTDGTLRIYDTSNIYKSTATTITTTTTTNNSNNPSPPKTSSSTVLPPTSPTTTIKLHEKTIKAVSGNLVDHNLVATGGSDKLLKIISLASGKPVVEWSDASNFSHAAEISDVAWNSENAHILASCAMDGCTTIWDTKTKKIFAQIKDPRGAPTTVVAWNPRDGSQLVTGSDDPTASTLRLYDLRSSKTTPLFEFHAPAGIFDISWCPHDASLLASCGKDNKLHLWDLSLLEQVTPPIGFEFSDASELDPTGLTLSNRSSITSPTMQQQQQQLLQQQTNNISTTTNLANNTISSTKFGQRSGTVFGGSGSAFGGGGGGSTINSSSSTTTTIGSSSSTPGTNPNHLSNSNPSVGDQHHHYSSSGNTSSTITITSTTGGGGAASSRRYELQWSSTIPGILTTCSFDRTIQIYSFISSSSKSILKTRNNSLQSPHQQPSVICGNPPNWLRRGCGASFGFGGKLITFGNKLEAAVQIQTNVSAHDTSNRAREFEHALGRAIYHDEQAQMADREHLKAFCLERARASKDDADREVWRFFTVLFAQQERMEIEQFLGYDEQAVLKEYNRSLLPILTEDGKFIDEQGNELPEPSTSNSSSSSNVSSNNPNDAKIDALIMRALVVGNFEAAVCLCFEHNRPADALMLSSLGGIPLQKRAQRAYLDMQTPTRPLMRVARAIYQDNMDLVASRFDSIVTNEVKNPAWKQALALLGTYAKQENFVSNCNDLGQKLETMTGMTTPATLCYMMARNVPKTLELWSNRDGKDDVELMAKALVFQRALPNPASLTEDITAMTRLGRLACTLADEGELDLAAKYALMGAYSNAESASLLFRVFASHPAQDQLASYLGQVPQFPYPVVYVGSGVTAAQLQQQQQQQAQQQQLQAQQQQQPSFNNNNTNVGSYGQQQQQPTYGVQQSNPSSYYQQQQQPIPVQPISIQPIHHQPNMPVYQPTTIIQPTPAAAPYVNGYGSTNNTLNTMYNNNNTQVAPQQQQQQQPPWQQQQQQSRTTIPPPLIQQQQQPPPMMISQSSAPIPATYSSPGPKIKENDGFGSTAGNPDAGAKYGNHNAYQTATSAWQQQQQQDQYPTSQQPQIQQHQQPPPKPAKIRDDMLPALASFQRLLNQLHHPQRPLSGAEDRQLKEAEKADLVLRNFLLNGTVSDYVCNKIKEMATALDHGQNQDAQNIVIALTSTDWNDHKDWLKGMRHLVLLAARDEAAQQQQQHQFQQHQFQQHHSAPSILGPPISTGGGIVSNVVGGGGPPIANTSMMMRGGGPPPIMPTTIGGPPPIQQHQQQQPQYAPTAAAAAVAGGNQYYNATGGYQQYQ
jgi:WD40 repeat protein